MIPEIISKIRKRGRMKELKKLNNNCAIIYSRISMSVHLKYKQKLNNFNRLNIT